MTGISYVGGFVFNEGGFGQVALLLKKKGPPYLIGMLNAVGGKVEPGESPLRTMEREWSEEVAAPLVKDWQEFCSLSYDTIRDGEAVVDTVHFFAGTLPYGVLMEISGREEEPVLVASSGDVREGWSIPLEGIYRYPFHNVQWLVTMAMHKLSGESKVGVYEIRETGSVR